MPKKKAQKGTVFRATVAAASISAPVDEGSRRNRIIVDEAQAVLQMGKYLGIDFGGKEKETIEKIIEWEEEDVRRMGEKGHVGLD